MVFKRENGKIAFYQWDHDQKIIVGIECTEVHFTNDGKDAPAVEVEEKDGIIYANVPNILLQEAKDITVYAYDDNCTKHQQLFRVIERPKPADYVYTETEVWTAEKAVADALKEAKESGEFDGKTSYLYADIEDGCLIIHGGQSDDITFEINEKGELVTVYE